MFFDPHFQQNVGILVHSATTLSIFNVIGQRIKCLLFIASSPYMTASRYLKCLKSTDGSRPSPSVSTMMGLVSIIWHCCRFSDAVLPVYQIHILSSPILLPPLSKRKEIPTYSLRYYRENKFYYYIGFSYKNMSFHCEILELRSY